MLTMRCFTSFSEQVALCWRYTSFNASRRLLCSEVSAMSTVCILQILFHCPICFGKQAQQSAPQFGGGRSAVLCDAWHR